MKMMNAHAMKPLAAKNKMMKLNRTVSMLTSKMVGYSLHCLCISANWSASAFPRRLRLIEWLPVWTPAT